MGVVEGGELRGGLNVFRSGVDGFERGGGELKPGLNELRFELDWFGIVVGVTVLGKVAGGLN